MSLSKITDLFLDALGMAFKVNIKILQSDCSKRYFFDQVNTSNLFEDTLYFVRTESLHFDPVVPSNFAEDRNINIDSDRDASIVIIDEVNADDVVEIKDIKTEIPSTSMDTDFLMGRSDTGNKKMQKKFHSIMSLRTIPLMQMNKTKKKIHSSLLHLVQLYGMDLTMSIHLLNLYSSFYLLSI